MEILVKKDDINKVEKSKTVVSMKFSLSEIRSFHNWKNHRLEKTILRIPGMDKYVMKEAAEMRVGGWGDDYAA